MSEDSDGRILHMPKPEKVLECIEKLRCLDLKEESDDEIDEKLNSILNDELNGAIVNYKILIGIEWLYRIRRLKELFGDVSGCWAPPAEKAQLGRCNGEGDSVLYTSRDIKTPFEELKIEHNCQVYMIKYKVKEETLCLGDIVPDYYKDNPELPPIFTKEGANSYNILREYIRSEFTKPVGKGTEYLYKISSSICRTRFKSDHDGWLYPSVHTRAYKENEKNNVALKAEHAREKLKIDSIVIGRLQREDNYIQIEFKGEIKEDKITWIPHEDKEFLNNL